MVRCSDNCHPETIPIDPRNLEPKHATVAMSGARVSLKTVSHTFLSAGILLEAVREIDFDAAPGETVALVGPSGCGKSTLLRMMMGTVAPSKGAVAIEASSGGPVKRAVVFQEPTLLPWLTAAENVRLPLELEKGLPPDGPSPDDMLNQVGLSGFGAFRPDQLSGGMQSRTSLARALVVQPNLLLLDEPFANLDEATSQNLVADLTKLIEVSKATVVLITHSLSQAVYMADRIVVMSGRPGRIMGVIPVPGPRPRKSWDFDDPSLVEIAAHVRRLLREAVHAPAL